jgi:signal-transduction protein with cAMP-binding, CBS, and nucleotidyltransferase domain
VRLMYLGSGLLLLVGGGLILVMPGLRQNRDEWKQALSLLKAAPARGGLGLGRVALPGDMDALVGLLPSLGTLSTKERENLLSHARVVEAASGTNILRHGEASDAAYFILSGRAVAGIVAGEGNYRSLSSMTSGDFFGEIAALTSAARTADVVAAEDTSLLQVPAQTLRGLMANPALSALFLGKMSERLGRTSLNELPRFAGVDQKDVLELRTATVEE